MLRAALPDYLKPVVTLAFYTGMRRGEILGLCWDCINFREGYIRLEDTKNDEPRTVYLNDEIFRMLVAQKRKRDVEFPFCPFVFFTPKGEPIGSFDKTWQTACRKVGLEERLFHDFSRSGVRNLVWRPRGESNTRQTV